MGVKPRTGVGIRATLKQSTNTTLGLGNSSRDPFHTLFVRSGEPRPSGVRVPRPAPAGLALAVHWQSGLCVTAPALLQCVAQWGYPRCGGGAPFSFSFKVGDGPTCRTYSSGTCYNAESVLFRCRLVKSPPPLAPGGPVRSQRSGSSWFATEQAQTLALRQWPGCAEARARKGKPRRGRCAPRSR